MKTRTIENARQRQAYARKFVRTIMDAQQKRGE